MYGLLISLFFLYGCSIPRIIYDYPNELDIRVIRTSKKEVNEKCLIGNWDDGTPVKKRYQSAAACWLPNKREIWIRWDQPWAIVHELCHADGQSKEDCSRIDSKGNTNSLPQK